VSRKPISSNLPALGIAEALRASVPLARLGERMRQSNACFAAVRPALPAGLAAHIRPGPVDEEGWSLLCANASVAAKLRQLVPRLEQRLKEEGLVVAAVRVKVLPA
jgi:hypothetical protein